VVDEGPDDVVGLMHVKQAFTVPLDRRTDVKARDLMMESVIRLPLLQQVLEAMTFKWKPPGAELAVLISADLSQPGRNWAECYAKAP
jgi:hypothetical protein